jgi:ribosomal protein S18 acetylase RimI-like enzyme
MKTPKVSTRPLQSGEWPIVENLFGKQGACGGCWCMWWRVAAGPKEWEKVKGGTNRDRFRDLVTEGLVHAVLAFVGDEPVGWCSFGPRKDFARVARVKALARDVPNHTWSIICFYIPAGRRRQGIARKLLAAATERAFDLGASEVEGYPVVPKSSPDRVPAAFASTGVPALFKAAGYQEMTKSPSYYRLWLRRADADRRQE